MTNLSHETTPPNLNHDHDKEPMSNPSDNQSPRESNEQITDKRKKYEPRNRPHRDAWALELLETGLRAKHPSWPDLQVSAEARRQLSEKTKQHPDLLAQLERLTLTPNVPHKSTINNMVEKAAVKRLAQWAWVTGKLQEQKRGRPGKRSFTLAVFTEMAVDRFRPEIKHVMDNFHASDQRDFVHGRLEAAVGKICVYDSMHSMLQAQDTRIWCEVNIDLIKELRNLPGIDALYKQIGRYAAIDGTDTQANVEQIPATGGNGSRHDKLIRGKRTKAGYKAAGLGKVYRGTKEMVLVCVLTGLPLVWGMYDGNVSERAATIELLNRLYELWPDCPLEYLIGDALYEDEQDFNAIIEFGYGIRPVFHRKQSEAVYGAQVAWTEGHRTMKGQFGVPECAHGLMKFRGTEGFLTREKRQEILGDDGKPLDPLAEIPIKHQAARIRWECPGGEPNCKEVATYVKDDARVYTYLPRAGNSKRAVLRQALYLKRNRIESVFADLKNSGIASPKHMVARWADDHETEHLIGARLTYMTAKRLVHERGDYKKVLAEARELGLVREPGEEQRDRLNDIEHQRMLRNRQAAIKPRPPATWHDDDSSAGGYSVAV